MAATGLSFRWLDILEKEFDKAFVDLEILIDEFDSEEPDVVYTARQKMATLSSCFAQLTHKAQTIFQNSAKVEELLSFVNSVVSLERYEINS
ncbi:Golgi-associated PDZ and coiled-coil motif-containing protein-like isoform X1 [Schistocerca americana]|nr:Golgi-associated PDZ and coiled-coil motif-containing protein-like isoform X1 [Schistocerca americana]